MHWIPFQCQKTTSVSKTPENNKWLDFSTNRNFNHLRFYIQTNTLLICNAWTRSVHPSKGGINIRNKKSGTKIYLGKHRCPPKVLTRKKTRWSFKEKTTSSRLLFCISTADIIVPCKQLPNAKNSEQHGVAINMDGFIPKGPTSSPPPPNQAYLYGFHLWGLCSCIAAGEQFILSMKSTYRVCYILTEKVEKCIEDTQLNQTAANDFYSANS